MNILQLVVEFVAGFVVVLVMAAFVTFPWTSTARRLQWAAWNQLEPTRVRLATAGDAAGILAIYAPIVRETAISFELEPPSVEEMRRRIDLATLRDLPWLVSELAGRIAGYAYASHHHERAAYQWSVDVSVYVAAEDARQGSGQVAVFFVARDRRRIWGTTRRLQGLRCRMRQVLPCMS